MKKIEVSSVYDNMVTIDPYFINDGIEYAVKNNLWDVKILPLNAFSEYKFNSPKELYSFYLDTESFKRNSRFFKGLFISDYIKINEDKIGDLYELSNLKSLSFEDKSFKFDFSQISDLEILHFKYNKGISNFGALKKLVELSIISFSESNLEILIGIGNLEILRLTRGVFASLSGVEYLKKLKRIDLAYASKIQDIKQITLLPNLSELHIEKCKLLNDFSFISGNDTIEELFIDNLNSLSFVPAMPNLKAINFWDCKDGDMTPLLESRSLKQINFYPNKKHYSHTIEQIIKKTGARRGRNI